MATIDKQLAKSGRIARCFENFKKLGQAKMTEGACSARIESLRELWIKFDSDHQELCDDEDTDSSDNYFKNDIYDQTEESYLVNLGLLKDYLTDSQTNRAALSAPPDGAVLDSLNFRQAKLPPIQIPTFSGELQEWVRFRDTFQEMIVRNTNLLSVYKMHYLNGSLSGEAAKLLEEIPASGDNFANAWKVIKDHYDNTRLLITKLVSKFMAIQPMNIEDAHEISRIQSSTKNILQALKAAGSPVNEWDHFTVFITTSRLTPQIQRKWEEVIARSEQPQNPPTFDALENFLETERLALTQLESAKESLTSNSFANKESSSDLPNTKFGSKSRFSKSVHVAQNGKSTSSCTLCKGSHFIINCEAFLRKTPFERKQCAIAKHLCFNCLAGHNAQECRNTKRCRHCSGKHHTLLHFDNSKKVDNQPKDPNKRPDDKTGKSTNVHLSLKPPDSEPVLNEINAIATDSVLLATAWVYAQSKDGSRQLSRALIDQGAQSSFISERLCQFLQLKRTSVRVSITGIGGGKEFLCKSTVEFSMQPHFKSNFSCDVKAYVIPKITTYKPFATSSTNWQHLKGITLADPNFGGSDRIDILLGAHIHAQIVEEGIRKGDRTTPIAMKTSLGWIVSGSTSTNSQKRQVLAVNHSATEVELNTLLRKFWEVEEPPRKKYLTADEQECEDYYKKTVTRTKAKRYEVRLPRKANLPEIWGNSYRLAVNTLHGTERRFSKNPKLKKSYVDCMHDYIVKGHMRLVANQVVDLNRCYFSPHHGIIKESSTTTQFRIVFNASQPDTETGLSVNNCLHVGPNLLPEIIDILTKWRRYVVVFVADVEKMFRQIWVNKKDQPLQAIVWRDEVDQEIQTYFLTTVTFGFAPSPYLANRTIKQLSEDEETNYPLAAKVLKYEIYMDDVLSGGHDAQEAHEKQKQVIKMMESGGFNLRK